MKQLKWTLARLAQERRPIRFLISRLLWKTGLCQYFDVRKDGYVIGFSPTSLASSLWVDPDYGNEDEQFIRRYLEAGDTVVDVGANIGTLTLLSALLAENVISVEAHPQTYKYLLRNIELNSFTNVMTFNVAIGEKDGTVMFSSRRADDQNKVSNTESGLTVPLKRLDTLLAKGAPVDLLKIDTEGYELFVLKGADNLLSSVKCIYFESYETNLAAFGHKTGDLISYLHNRGFVVGKIIADHINLIDEGHRSIVCENLVAIKDMDDFIRRTAYLVNSSTPGSGSQ